MLQNFAYNYMRSFGVAVFITMFAAGSLPAFAYTKKAAEACTGRCLGCACTRSPIGAALPTVFSIKDGNSALHVPRYSTARIPRMLPVNGQWSFRR